MRVAAVPRVFWGLLRKDFLLLVRRKKQLFAFILLPLIVAGIFLVLFQSDVSRLSVGYCDLDGAGDRVAAGLETEFKLTELSGECGDALREAVLDGTYDVGILVPRGFSSNLQGLRQARVDILADTTDIAFANFLSWKVESTLQAYNEQLLVDRVETLQAAAASASRTLRGSQRDAAEDLLAMDPKFVARPIVTNLESVSSDVSPKHAAVAYVFPIIAWLVGLMLVSTGYIHDKTTGMLARIKSSSSVALYVLSKLVFFTLVTLAQLLLVVTLFVIAGGRYSFVFGDWVLLTVFVGSTVTLIGLLIGTLTKSEGAALLLSLLLAFPLMLLSGAFLPLQSTPGLIRWVVGIMPMAAHINAAKDALLIGASVGTIWIIPAVLGAGLVWWMVRRDY